jgi:hypothetical protein
LQHKGGREDLLAESRPKDIEILRHFQLTVQLGLVGNLVLREHGLDSAEECVLVELC